MMKLISLILVILLTMTTKGNTEEYLSKAFKVKLEHIQMLNPKGAGCDRMAYQNAFKYASGGYKTRVANDLIRGHAWCEVYEPKLDKWVVKDDAQWTVKDSNYSAEELGYRVTGYNHNPTDMSFVKHRDIPEVEDYSQYETFSPAYVAALKKGYKRRVKKIERWNKQVDKWLEYLREKD